MDQAANEINANRQSKKPNWSLWVSTILFLTSFFVCSFSYIASRTQYQFSYAIFQLYSFLNVLLAYSVAMPFHWVAFYLAARNVRGKTRLWVISVFIITPFLIIGALFAIEFGFAQTVPMGTKNYHLAVYHTGIPWGPGSWRYRYGVYECDWLNVFCKRLYQTDDTWMGNETADLVPDDNAKTISLVIFDEVVYSQSVE